MSVLKVQLFSIPVTDQDRARDFYVDVLGFELVREMPMGPGQRWIQLRPPGAETSVTLVTWFASMPPGCLTGVVLDTDDLDRDLTRLRERGGVTDLDISEQPWGRSVGFADPDGNRLTLQTTAPGS